MNRNDGQGQGGQSIVLVAVAMVALVIFVAITVDMSNAYHHRRVAQNAADAAALAGAEELGRQINNKKPSDSRIKADMNDFAERNGIEDTNGILADAENTNVEGFYLDSRRDVIGVVGGGSVPSRAVGIRAVTHTDAPAFFGGIMGFDGYPLQARAAVLHEVACTGGWCMLPIAVKDTGFLDATQSAAGCFNMWDGAGAGNFGWLNWSLNEKASSEEGGAATYTCKDESLYGLGFTGELPGDCSAQCLDINMDPNYCRRIPPGTIEVGDPVGGTTGVKNGDFIRDWLKYYITHPEPVKIVVYDTTMGNKKTGQEAGCATDVNQSGLRYSVAGFACFHMTGFRLSHGKGATQCDLGVDPLTGEETLHCQECTWNDDGTLACPGYSPGLVCDPSTAVDHPGDCTTADGNPCEFETGDVNRITGWFVSCVSGGGGDCKAIGNMLAPRLDE